MSSNNTVQPAPTEEEDPRKFVEVEHRSSGYAHVNVSGRCGPDVTVEDIERRFYHPYFGGRGASVRDGRFYVTIHTD